MKHLTIYIIGTCWVTLELLSTTLGYEEIPEDSYGIYYTDEVYYEEPDLLGGVEGVDYMLVYRANDFNKEEAED